MSRLIAITGGIGAGKSVVSHILRAMGYEVYDTDREAKRLMDESPLIKQQLISLISPSAVNTDGSIDRRHIASVVFTDNEKLRALNSIVHGAVREDIRRWSALPHRRNIIFIETAILYQSELNRMVDCVWDVTATEELRIKRVMTRNNCDRESVAARIASQNYVPDTPHSNIYTIVNDDVKALLPQIMTLLNLNTGLIS